MFTRVFIAVLGNGSFRSIVDGETGSFVQYVGNVSDWRASVDGVAWVLLGLGLIVRFTVSRQWQTKKHYRKYLYEIPFVGSAMGYCAAVVGSIFNMFN